MLLLSLQTRALEKYISHLETLVQVDIDFETEPIGLGKDGKKIFFRDIWPSNEEVAHVSCSTCLSMRFAFRLKGFKRSHFSSFFRLCNQVCCLICLGLRMKQSPREIRCGINYLCLRALSMPGTQHQLTYMIPPILKI